MYDLSNAEAVIGSVCSGSLTRAAGVLLHGRRNTEVPRYQMQAGAKSWGQVSAIPAKRCGSTMVYRILEDTNLTCRGLTLMGNIFHLITALGFRRCSA